MSKMEVAIQNLTIGSLLITFNISTLPILERLWQDYCSGHLGEVVQNAFATDEIMNDLGLTELKLKTTILEEDYRACKQTLKEFADAVASSTVNDSNQGVKQEPLTSKRKASEAFEQCFSGEGFTGKKHHSGDQVCGTDQEMILERNEMQMEERRLSQAKREEFNADIVFAIDYSSFVQQQDKTRQAEFVQCLAKFLNVEPGKSRASVVAYGETADVMIGFESNVYEPFPAQTSRTDQYLPEKSRRLDLALAKATTILKAEEKSLWNEQRKKIVILVTTGNQGVEKDSLQSISEEIHQLGYQLIVVPVGISIDFKELSMMIKRPQSLFPLSSLDTSIEGIVRMAVEIKKTSDVVAGTKEKVKNFSGSNPETGFGEKTSDCLDVMEGACYFLCEEKQKKSKGVVTKPAKVEKLIQQSINDFNSILVSKSNVTISIAVCGPVGVGKSYLLNFLLTHDLSDDKACEVPLPSAEGGSQTPLPIRVKYRNSVKVSFFKTRNDPEPDLWYSEMNLSKTTLVEINEVLKNKIGDDSAGLVEIEGPFPIFQVLKNRGITSCGHLELEVDVEFVDLPGLGAKGESEISNAELSNADIVLFFECGQSGREVTPLDLKNVFSNHHMFEYTSRPKLTLVVNCKSTTAIPPDTSCLYKKKKEELLAAWKPFLKNDDDDKDDTYTADYRNAARAKLPHIGGEELLVRLKDECEVLIFHPENTTLLASLKQIINHHVDEVKVKRQIHPILKSIYPVAKRLKRQTSLSATMATKEKSGISPPSFELYFDMADAEDLVESFNYDKVVLDDDDIEKVFQALYNKFIYSLETRSFLFHMLQLSLEHFITKLKACLEIPQISESSEVPHAYQVVTEMLCNSRIQKFCANNAPDFLRQVLDKGKNRNHLADYKRDWQASDSEGRKHLFQIFLHILLKHSKTLLERPSRDLQDNLSPFKLRDNLLKDLEDLRAVKFDAHTGPDLLEAVKGNVSVVVEFCKTALSEINPHPSLHFVPLPETPEEARETKDFPVKPVDKLLKEMRQYLTKPSKRDPVGYLERKLNVSSGALSCGEDVDKTLWAKLLVDILCDENHFQLNLGNRLLDPSNTEVKRLTPQATKLLFAYQRSQVRCKVVEESSCTANQIILKKSVLHQEVSLEAVMSTQMHKQTQKMVTLTDLSCQVAPVFIPISHPGPSRDMTGNFLLQDDPWAEDMDEREQDEGSAENTMDEESQKVNVFLVVEPQHLQMCKDAVSGKKSAVTSKIKMHYVVLPGNGAEMGVIKGIIKVLADCLNFQLFWIIDDSIKSMYQFDQNDCTWNKCQIHRGLLFGQRVFQTCHEKTLRPVFKEKQDEMCDTIIKEWPEQAKRTRTKALGLCSSDEIIAAIQKNPWRLMEFSPFKEDNMVVDCQKDASMRATLNALKPKFEDQFKSFLFGDASKYVGSISLGHVSTRKYDYTTKFPTSHFKRTDQGYKMVLLNSDALKGKNFVSDDMIFDDQELGASDYPGIKNIEKSFSQALAFNGVSNFQVICFTHDEKKLASPLSSRC
ncbi:uncharacterized protein LOC144631588 [Oculina patagonica]